jgi:hypothetical protein
LVSLAACGKKAPLRLPEDRPVDKAPTPRARVQEGRVILDFRVPRHRLFPEREEPWVLARILRQTAPSREFVEAGAILEGAGFPFEAPLAWSDQVLAPRKKYTYRVEFRDGARRRRALSETLSVSWDRVPESPSGLRAVAADRAIILTWNAPGGESGEVRYRLYRRLPPQSTREALAPEPITANRFADSMIEAGRDYCYAISAALLFGGLEVEGPAGAEACARAIAAEPQPERPPGTAP